MTDTFGSITGIKPGPEEDGGHMIQVADFEKEPFEVWIRPDQVAHLIQVLQTGSLSKAAEDGTSRHFQMLTVENVELANQERETALLLTTAECGALVFRFSDESLRRLSFELRRARLHLSAGPATH